MEMIRARKREVRFMKNLSHLDESNVGRLLPEALTADVQAVFADKTSLVRADTAATRAFSEGARTRVPNLIVGHIDCSGMIC